MGPSAPVPAKGVRERLITSHLPLVRRIARRHVGRGEELDDLVQVGAVGLVKASDRFDPSRGVTFATFAAPVIEGEIRHHLRDRTRPVRLPRELERMRSELRRHRAELASALGRAPAVHELAEALGVEERDIESALIAERARDSVSISSEVEATALPADGGALTSSDDRLLLVSSLHSLDERQRRIVFLRFHADMTERQIARELGLSQAHVSRLLALALAKLRDELASASDVASAGDTTPDIAKPAARDDPLKPATASIAGTGISAGGGTDDQTFAQYLELRYRFDVRSQGDGERATWTASVEQLPGCVATGDTPEEAVAGLRPAKESWLKSAIAEGREIPVPGREPPSSRAAHSHSGRFLVRMPKLLHEQLARAAEQQQTSLNRLVTDVLAAAVARGDLGEPSADTDPSTDTGAPRAELEGAVGVTHTSARSIRLALATNLAVLVIAGIVAVVLLVLALERTI